MEGLREELNDLIDVAGKINGIHKRVAEKVGFTPTYIQNVRRGDVLNNNKKSSILTIKALINAYRNELETYAKEIDVVL